MCIAFAAAALAQQDVDSNGAVEAEPRVRFTSVDVYVDSGAAPLAAYQFELTAETGNVKIVGIEGGDHPAFAEPPYYDPAALSQDRVIIAAFNTGDDLPSGQNRVARIHVQITGNQEPEFVVQLHVAASSDGEPIEASATASTGSKGENS